MSSGPDAGGAPHLDVVGRLLRHVQAAILDLASVATTAEVADSVLHRAVPALGVAGGSLWLLDRTGSSLEFIGASTYDESVPVRFARIPLDAALPGPEVLRTGSPVLYRSTADRDARWPLTAGTPSAAEATAVLPLIAGGDTFGCLAIGIEEARDFSADELDLFRALADHCAVALDRARAREGERASSALLAFLLEASTRLLGATDVEGVLERFVDLVVPDLADWASVHLPDGDVLQRVALRLPPADRHREAGLLAAGPLPVATDTPIAEAYRTGEMQLGELTEHTLAAAGAPPEVTDAARALALHAVAAIPIRSGSRIVGVATLAFADETRPLDDVFVATATAVVERVAVALDNARLYERERSSAVTLARAILPTRLPSVDHVALGACYLPAEEQGVVIGGDWYDAFRPANRSQLMFGVGDAAGHGVAAASVMAKLRNGARAFAAFDLSPGTLLNRLGDLLVDSDADFPFATAVYATLDPATGQLRWAAAGHPPPLLVRRGTPVFLDAEVAPPLGALDGPVPTNDVTLQVGDAVVLYTDGVIEARDASIEVGLQRLLAAAADVDLTGDLDSVCSGLVEVVVGQRRRLDDCCVLVVQQR